MIAYERFEKAGECLPIPAIDWERHSFWAVTNRQNSTSSWKSEKLIPLI
jgi:hypothetical protein